VGLCCDHETVRLILLPEAYAVCRFPAGAWTEIRHDPRGLMPCGGGPETYANRRGRLGWATRADPVATHKRLRPTTATAWTGESSSAATRAASVTLGRVLAGTWFSRWRPSPARIGSHQVARRDARRAVAVLEEVFELHPYCDGLVDQLVKALEMAG
jgi:hypothetical protein